MWKAQYRASQITQTPSYTLATKSPVFTEDEVKSVDAFLSITNRDATQILELD